MLTRPLHHAGIYPWYLALASLDIIITWLIVFQLGGLELNGVAAWIIRNHGLGGMILFKFLCVALVVTICEYLAAEHAAVSSRVARAAVGVSVIPVLFGGGQLALIGTGIFLLP